MPNEGLRYRRREALLTYLVGAAMPPPIRAVGGLDRVVELGAVDEIVAPADTRRRIDEIIRAVPAGRGFHRNIPL
ncbi:MAG TPA: hypothetical protein VGQ92_09475 [Actinoplanes sp.]|jgi:hypothetical protein|nr:hypothetical protein [Actinoplanes sp.]